MNQSVYMHLSISIRMRPDALGFIAKNCRPMGSAGQKGFICIFCCAENSCFAAIQLAAWILFSNPAASQKEGHPNGCLSFVIRVHYKFLKNSIHTKLYLVTIDLHICKD